MTVSNLNISQSSITVNCKDISVVENHFTILESILVLKQILYHIIILYYLKLIFY